MSEEHDKEAETPKSDARVSGMIATCVVVQLYTGCLYSLPAKLVFFENADRLLTKSRLVFVLKASAQILRQSLLHSTPHQLGYYWALAIYPPDLGTGPPLTLSVALKDLSEDQVVQVAVYVAVALHVLS